MAEVVSVDPARKVVVVRESTTDQATKQVSVSWNDASKITRGGAAATGADIAVGDTLKMTYRQAPDGRNLASDIVIIKAKEKP